MLKTGEPASDDFLKRRKIEETAQTGLTVRASQERQGSQKLTGHEKAVTSCRFSADGRFLVSAGEDNFLQFWKANGEAECLGTLKNAHRRAITEVHWTCDSQNILTSSADLTVALTDGWTGQNIQRFKAHEMCVNTVCLAGNGEPLLVSGSDDATALMWDPRTALPQGKISVEAPVLSSTLCPRGQRAFLGCLDDTIQVWDIRKGGLLPPLLGHAHGITGLDVSPDGSKLASISLDMTVKFWQIPHNAEPNCANSLSLGCENRENERIRIQWDRKSEVVGCGSNEGVTYLLDGKLGRFIDGVMGHTAGVNEVAFHPRCGLMATASKDKSLLFRDYEVLCNVNPCL